MHALSASVAVSVCVKNWLLFLAHCTRKPEMEGNSDFRQLPRLCSVCSQVIHFIVFARSIRRNFVLFLGDGERSANVWQHEKHTPRFHNLCFDRANSFALVPSIFLQVMETSLFALNRLIFAIQSVRCEL